MIAMEVPKQAHEKKSIFRRLTFKEAPSSRPMRPVHPLALPTPPSSPLLNMDSQYQQRTPRQLRRASMSLLTPPSSPEADKPARRHNKRHVEKSSISRPSPIPEKQPYEAQLPRFSFEQPPTLHHQRQPQRPQRPQHHIQQKLQKLQRPAHTRHDSSQSSASSATSTSSTESLSRSSSSSNSSISTSPTNSDPRILPSCHFTLPFPPSHAPSITPWNVFLPPSHTYALYLGFAPTCATDKWFIYSEGPDALGKLKVHLHRSGTGTKIAELFVVMDVKGEGAGKVVGVKWDAGMSGRGRVLEGEAKSLVRGACVSCLGIRLEDPM